MHWGFTRPTPPHPTPPPPLLLKNTLSFLPSPLFNQQIVQAPFFLGNSPTKYIREQKIEFFRNPHNINLFHP